MTCWKTGSTAWGTSASGMAMKSYCMAGPFITISADTQAGGATVRSDRRAASRGERTTEAPTVSSSQTDEDAARADRVQLRPNPAVPVALAHEPCPAPPGFRLEQG